MAGSSFTEGLAKKQQKTAAPGERHAANKEANMVHGNPILAGNPIGKRFITAGEIMLRLTPPNYEKIRMCTSFEASYGGSEANIALALANLGVDSTFFSVVPENSLGKSAIRMLRSNDVHCTPIILSTPEQTPTHRLGTYYLETGYGIRPSKVIYDRKHSAMSEFDYSSVDLRALLQDFDWLHMSGITPALSPSCAELTMNMLKIAKELGLTVSFDGNFRSTLWTWNEARDFCTRCLPYVDILLGIEPYHLYKDPECPEKGDWKDGVPEGLLEYTQNSVGSSDEKYYMNDRGRYTNAYCQWEWKEKPEIEMDSTYYDQHKGIYNDSKNALIDIVKEAAKRDVSVIGLIFPQSPEYAKTGAFGRYGLRRSVAQKMISELEALNKKYPNFVLMDENKMGKHDYDGQMAIDEDHLCNAGAMRLTSRLNDVLLSLESKK